jgi:Ala-tRNA(Pro) deacylase
MSCKERLITYLGEQRVPFQVHEHQIAYTADAMAAVEHIPGKLVAKAVMGFADVQLVMLVLPATSVVDRTRAATALGAREFRLAAEPEFSAAFPDCEKGALPVFGNLFKVPLYVDTSLTADETITFPAGTHTQSITMRYADFDRLAMPTVVDFARQKAGFTA